MSTEPRAGLAAQGDSVPIRPASTTMLLRQAPDLEVLMVRRNQMIDFVAGAMVFPGGRVDPGDADPAWRERVTGWDSVPEDERAPRIAAIREAFEESGVVIGAGFQPGPDLMPLRKAVEAGEIAFSEAMRSLGVTVDLTRLTLFSRWVTPPVAPKRFDTRFYLVAMPKGQVVSSDGRETVATEWIAPAEALRLAAAGERRIVFPTRMNLRILAESPTISAAEDAAGSRAKRPVIPRIETRNAQRFILLDPEDGYGRVEEELEVP